MNHTVFAAMLDQGFKPGQLVLSKAGHDHNRVYLITAIEGNFAFCVDGDYRPLEKPKRKRVRHLRALGELVADWQTQIAALNDAGQQNALIKSLIKKHPGWSLESSESANC